MSYQKFANQNPTFTVNTNQTNQKLKMSNGMQIYLGFEDDNKKFVGNNTKGNIVLYSSDYTNAVNGLTVEAKNTDSTNTATEIYYTTQNYEHLYQITYNNVNLFQLNVIRSKQTYKLYMELVTGYLSEDYSMSIFAIFNSSSLMTNKITRQQYSNLCTVSFNLYNKSVFLAYINDLIGDGNIMTVGTYNQAIYNNKLTYLLSSSNYDQSKYGNVYIYNLNNTEYIVNSDLNHNIKSQLQFGNKYSIYAINLNKDSDGNYYIHMFSSFEISNSSASYNIDL